MRFLHSIISAQHGSWLMVFQHQESSHFFTSYCLHWTQILMCFQYGQNAKKNWAELKLTSSEQYNEIKYLAFHDASWIYKALDHPEKE